MTGLYVSRARLSQNAERGSRGALVDLLARTMAFGDAEHRLVWTLFGDKRADDGKRPFVYRTDGEGMDAVFHLISTKKPEPADPIWEISSRPLNAPVVAGMRFRFSVRASPAVSVTGIRNRRHDVVQLARRAGDRRPVAVVAEEAGSAWMHKQAARHGFRVDEKVLRAYGYRVRRFTKAGESNHELTIAQMDFAGMGEVVDVAAFLEALRSGIGPAKGYGCGALLIAPP